MNKPILLTKVELVEPLNQALERLEKIRQRKASNEDKIIFEGLFVLAIATFENSFNDTLKVLLTHIPEKLDNKIESLTKEDLIEGNPLEKAIQLKINSISYKNLKEILTYFIKTTNIKEDTISEDLIEKLQEIKATRNLLLHNNLIVNSIYNETAGILKRTPQNGKLEINQDYLYSSIVTLREILKAIKSKLVIKYKDYTHLKALRELWKYTFTTPIMNFENEWLINEIKDCVVGHNFENSKRNGLSSGEEILYNIWFAHLHGGQFNFGSLNFFNIGTDFREKVSFILTKIDLLKSRG